ncbi:MAG: hypothetical protein ACKVI6_01640 [Candidatus Poseidoniales archaeon]|jgi:uncharacterized membrane protein HdeD (DUF308 family)|tara:strand:- start:481 stop:669 length:189 start_codon:yes stop_codon:yes gene_type:complete
MILRQRLGILLMIIFLPINGPILRLLLTSLDLPNIGEFKFFVLCIFMFIIGAIMTFTPKLKL